jgi:hypothetical protein
MKKIIAITIVGIITLSGLGVVAISNSETEFWGVVVVALDTSQQPYIYNSLMQSNNWKSDHIKLLWKENATKGEILNSIDWLVENADNDDIVLFSVDSHGTYQKGEYGIWPWDGNANGIITVAELDAKFDLINSKGLCLIFDCCLSGSFIDTYQEYKVKKIFNKFRSPRFIIPEPIIEGMEDDNRVIIMGTMPNGLGSHWIDYDLMNGKVKSEVSPSSVLSEAFIKKYDMNNDGYTSAEEGFIYLKENFRKWAILAFLLLPMQIYMYLTTGFLIKPFPTINDSYDGELLIIT